MSRREEVGNYPPLKEHGTRDTNISHKGQGTRNVHPQKGHGTRDNHPAVDRQTPAKTLPSPNFVGGR